MLTVGQVAETLGLTVRTLHHWDEVDLAAPSHRSHSGYRLYNDGDLQKLKRILIYRELGLELEQIRKILQQSTVDVHTALRDQHHALIQKINRLSQLRDDVDAMVATFDHGITLSENEQRRVFGPGWDPQWPTEARQKYGDSAQWRYYAERAAHRSPEQWSTISAANQDFEQALIDAVADDTKPGGPRANALVEQHRAVFSSYFPLSRQMQVCLGRMYEQSPDYAAHYDHLRPGLASILRAYIEASAKEHGVDLTSVRWE